MNIRIIQMVTAVIAAIIIITGCNGNGVEQPPVEVVPVKTAVVKLEDISIPVHTSGRLYPKAMVKLSFKTGGLIDKIYVDEGDTVKKGQLLASLDLSEINARVNQARNGFLKAERDLKRVENLYKDRAATLEQLQNVKTAFEVAESDLKIAKFNLEHSRIKAPANGKILKRLSEAGEMTGPGSPAFLFGSTADQWVVKAGVSERDIVRIALKDGATVEFDAYPGKQFSAVVTEISESMDPAGGTYEIEMAVNDEGLKLAAGFVAKVRIEPSEKNTYHVIPVDSIVEGEGSEGIVFTVKNNKAVKLKIMVAHIFPETVAVRSGLENVKVVVTSGAAYLTDGIQVKAAEREEK
jgi:RND family efflux transporter MFP subunit